MPSSSDVVIGDLRPAEQAEAVELLADAFLEFPAMHVLVGNDPGARERLKRLFVMEFAPESPVRALAAVSEGRLAGALTYVDSPGCSAVSAGRMMGFMRIAGPRIVRAVRMFGRIEREHPKTQHRHLPTVGVRPELQSRGIGRQLMEAFGERCDADGRTAYLETIRWSEESKPSHERFYGRLGYVVSAVVPMTEEWSVVTMLRPARTVTAG